MEEKIIFRSFKTENNTNLRILISCHKNDYNEYVDKIANDIFSIQNDCNIYFLDNPDYYPGSDEELNYYKSFLSTINLFVFPISKDFLNANNLSFDIDFQFAINNNCRILPIFIQGDLSTAFNEKCGFIQALDMTSNELFEDSYNNKLKKFINSTIVSSDTIENVKNAFDAYIFLSYRKIDKIHAQNIMSLIHKNDFMRDIAIWYDDNLTLGEDFNDEIKAIMQKSNIVSFVVTPNIYMPSGNNQNNYVESVEYPEAVNSNKKILAIESEDTDKKILNDHFKDFPDTVNIRDEEKLASKLKELLFKEGIKENNDPEHLYFIGMAYLYAIDVEKNIQKALDLLNNAAEYNYIPAMMELAKIYKDGIGVPIDCKKAILYQLKVISCMFDLNEDKRDDEIIDQALQLASIYELQSSIKNSKDFTALNEACEYYEACHEWSVGLHGEADRKTLSILNKYVISCIECGSYMKAEKKGIDCYSICIQNYPKDDELTLSIMETLALAYTKHKKYDKALEMYKDIYNTRSQISSHSRETLLAINNLALAYTKLKKYDEAIKTCKENYKLINDSHDKNSPDTINALYNLAVIYEKSNNIDEAFNICNECYSLYVNIYGKYHPAPVKALEQIANIYHKRKDYEKEIEIRTQIYNSNIRIYNYFHSKVSDSLSKLDWAYILYSQRFSFKFKFIKYYKIEFKRLKVLFDYYTGRKFRELEF